MKIKSVHLTNFASYESLDFAFNDSGLTLISGPTGAGKSTLCDAIPWVLFGRTAKDGTVDEVRSWGGKGSTEGILHLEDMSIVRRRNPNDLYFYRYKDFADAQTHRGKDLADTQNMINRLLGVTPESYLAGAYFHEFSQTAQFFTANAKSRRALLEQVVDLSKIKKLQEKLAEDKKVTNQAANTFENQIRRLDGVLEGLETSIAEATSADFTFEADRDEAATKIVKRISNLKSVMKPLDYYKDELNSQSKEIAALRDRRAQLIAAAVCAHCGGPVAHADAEALQKEIEAAIGRQVTTASLDKENRLFRREYDQLVAEGTAILDGKNTYKELIKDLGRRAMKTNREKVTAQQEFEKRSLHLADLSVLTEIVEEYRSLTIQNTIAIIQDNTNKNLSDYFDAEIRVAFTATTADKLEVELYKDGYNASYTQLSKGQRCLLKLCFGTAVMQAIANRHGIDFGQVFFDEALDGLDENMKLKAINLLQNMPHNGIYLVEHSPTIKAMVDSQYQVTMENGRSQIEKK